MTLSENLRQDLIAENAYAEGDGSGYELLEQLGVDRDSAFADFFAHGTDATYVGVHGHEIDDVIWMIENSGYLEALGSLRNALGLPPELLPLDPFEGGGGFFYSTTDGGVYEIELGEKLQSVVSGESAPDWPDFETFLRWFFGLDG